MNLSELLAKDTVRRVEPDAGKAKQLLAAAERDLNAASDIWKAGYHDWSLAIAYNAMLSAGMALMAKQGYVSRSDAHHLAVVQFCAAILPSQSSTLVGAFNRYRVRRHDVVYGEAESVGKEEAKRAMENAAAFVEKIREKIR